VVDALNTDLSTGKPESRPDTTSNVRGGCLMRRDKCKKRERYQNPMGIEGGRS